MKKSKHLKIIIACLFPIILDSLGFGLVYPVFTAIFSSSEAVRLVGTSSLKVINFYLGLSYMLFPLCMLFGASFFGDLSDILGRKKVIALCMIGMFIGFILMAVGLLTHLLFLLLIGRALTGLMAGSQPIAQAAIADSSDSKTKAFNMSVMTFTISIGLVIGPLMGGVFSDPSIAKGFGFETPFLIAGFLAVVGFFWILLGFKETFKPLVHKKIHPLRPILIFKEGLVNPIVRYLVFIFLCNQVGFGVFFQTILIQIREEFQYDRLLLGLFNGWMGLGFALGLVLIIPHALKRLKTETVGILSLFLTGIFEILSGINDHMLLTWILALPVVMADIIAYTVIMTMFSDSADRQSQGWVMGIFGAVVAISFVFAGFSTNLLHLIGTHWIILLGGVLQLIGGLLMLFFARLYPNYAHSDN